MVLLSSESNPYVMLTIGVLITYVYGTGPDWAITVSADVLIFNVARLSSGVMVSAKLDLLFLTITDDSELPKPDIIFKYLTGPCRISPYFES